MANEALFETQKLKGRLAYKVFASSVSVGIILIWVYRATHVSGTWIVWIGMFGAELWFGFYWMLSQALRWNPVHRKTFKTRLSSSLPPVDIFVCTADPVLEPPMMVINTVLSVMAYDYPPDKLAVYLSDDAASDVTFYALVQASRFARHWVPFCAQFKIESPSPQAYFALNHNLNHNSASIKKLYDEMEERIEFATKMGRIPEDAAVEHPGFCDWDSYKSCKDHGPIVQIVIDGDEEAIKMPHLVYLAREKRPHCFHNFKAGAMNALIRVSGEMSNAPIILNVDCDMYSNNPQSIKDALCFFLDDHQVAYVQFPQNFHNLTRNELYGGSLRVIYEVQFHGLDGIGGPLYIGTGCFHRRDTLCGRKWSNDSTFEWIKEEKAHLPKVQLEQRLKPLATSTFENNTQWGHQVGVKYGCLVEDVLTGLSIQCNGWKSVYFNPQRKAFLGVTTTTLLQTLVQHKRWSEGDLHILISAYSPLSFAIGKIDFRLVMGYCVYCLWSLNCFPTLCYSLVPSLYLLNGLPLFPKVSSMWVIPFLYVIFAEHVYSLSEYLFAGGTTLGWWNEQRMWLYKRTSSYVFAVTDIVLKLLGRSDSRFVISAKVSGEEVMERYKQEKMEFGESSPMLLLLSSIAMLNLFCLCATAIRVVIFRLDYVDLALQIVLCASLSLINLPLYGAAFLRKDKGRIPSSITLKFVLIALTFCALFSVC